MSENNIVIKPFWMIDHLCFRCESFERYEYLKTQFISFSKLLIESEVNGRPIATFNFHEPITFGDYQIPLVELPAPKVGKKTKEGFEHIEIVCSQSFDNLKLQYANLAIDASGLSKEFNQEFEISLDGCAIKFHHVSLASVIALEKNTKIHSAIIELNILKILKEFRPLIAGTFPLGINVHNSDVDMILCCSDFENLKTICENNFSHLEKFNIIKKNINNQESLIVRFNFKNVLFELFAQNVESVEQVAYRHFQTEERLLSLGGQSLINLIKKEKENGIETEAAFSKILNLQGDPFKAILNLQSKSEKELKVILNQIKY